MSAKTPRQEWDALTHDQKQYLEDFVTNGDITHTEELETLGFALFSKHERRWLPTLEGLECYEAGTGLSHH